jgi:hypothetical protein
MTRPWWSGRPQGRLARAALATAALALLAACGPGVGGSGTGEDQSALPSFGASASALCSGELAALLACAPASGGALDPGGGTGLVAFRGQAGGEAVSLVLQGNGAELRVGCTLLRFRGQWGQLAGQPPRFYGYLDPDGAPVVATLEARLVGGEIELTLRDANGSALLGPLRVAAGTAPGCG